MNKPQGILLVLSGPSGAGKGTICARLREKRDHMAYSVSCTTRQPRNGEVDGVNYFFKTRDEFEEMIKNGGLLEHASVYGNYYGTPRQYVLDKLAEGLDVILEIDPQGALQVKKSYPDGVFVFIVPPSLDELSKRIYKRGTDAVDVIKRRLSAATSERTPLMVSAFQGSHLPSTPAKLQLIAPSATCIAPICDFFIYFPLCVDNKYH